jgi:mannan endo-1,4-beta-mannosidase
VYNTTVLEKLDVTLSILSKYGMKAIISPHDAGHINSLNGCDAYCARYGNQSTFYSSAEAKQDYDNRLAAILNYQSPNFGKSWANLSEAIWAFDLQNEPFVDSSVFEKLDDNDPDDWLCGRAGVLRNTMDLSANIAVATGGIGGSEICCNREWNLLPKALYCDAIDIMSVHGYMSKVRSSHRMLRLR